MGGLGNNVVDEEMSWSEKRVRIISVGFVIDRRRKIGEEGSGGRNKNRRRKGRSPRWFDKHYVTMGVELEKEVDKKGRGRAGIEKRKTLNNDYRKQLERRTRQLEMENEELSRFNHVARLTLESLCAQIMDSSRTT
eukprot:CAMPEP_0184683946 /NCGR_PEP_ID=MMETSP0312-20130426/13289_1 /TAXON_ID=31354 /ORGANISM="Compsopogon coeruleus, Strain SAG 36.94" /LENGTH=135 /DNA_ID=CAMNT_0027136691 /DNA_START=70 /DNA_END=477 /DNA_ORIENTATION=-